MKMKIWLLAVLLSLVSLQALARGGGNSRYDPVPDRVEGLTGPDTVTLNAVLLSWEEAMHSEYYHIYGKAPGSTYKKVGQSSTYNRDINGGQYTFTHENTVKGEWSYVVRGCNYSIGCGPFSAPKKIKFQACHDPVKKNGVQAFSIVTNTNQCINLDVTANKETYLIWSNLTPRNKYFTVLKNHNAENTALYGQGYSFASQPLPLGTAFTPLQSKVSLNMTLNHERTQVMVVYDETSRVLSIMYVDYEGETSL